MNNANTYNIPAVNCYNAVETTQQTRERFTSSSSSNNGDGDIVEVV